jgi:protein ImuB
VLAAMILPRFAFVVTATRLGVADEGFVGAIAPIPGAPPRIGEVSARAAAHGVRLGMRLSEAFALCPQLALLPADPVAVADAADRLVRRVEGLGVPVEPAAAGRLLFETGPVEQLYGGRAAVLIRVQDCAPRARIGAAPSRFAALAATRRSRPNRPVVVTRPAVREFLAPLPTSLLVEDGGVDPQLVAALARLGIERLGALEALGRITLRDRFGPEGEHAWLLAAGEELGRFAPRTPTEAIRESLVLADATITRGALDHALRVLIERLLAHPARNGREPRTLRLGARLVGGGSWSCETPLREPTADPARLRLALATKLERLPAPAEEVSVELGDLAPGNRQQPLVADSGAARQQRLADAVAQVRAALGADAALHVVTVDTKSRLPERRYGLAPR